LTATTEPALCDASTGSIRVSISGGATPYSFAWTGPNGFTSNIQNLANLEPGEYTITVTDNNGCQGNLTVTVEQQDSDITLNAVPTPTICTAENGTITLSITDGLAPYTFAWTGPNGFTSNIQNPTGLATGNYTVQVTDANGCQGTTSVNIIQENTVVGLTASTTPTLCDASNGAIRITASGGTSPFTYAWTGPNGFTSNIQNPANLEPGQYNVTVTDRNGCFVTQTFNVAQDIADFDITATVRKTTCNEDNGSVSLTISGGTPAYRYEWTGPDGFTSNAKDISGLKPGTYSVTVIDSNGCKAERSFNVSGSTEMTLSSIWTTIDCFGRNNGSIVVNVSGGTAPHTYLWSNGATTNAIYSLAPGTYSVTVTDADGCSVSRSWEISQPDAPLVLREDHTHVTINSAKDGTITLGVTGGTPLPAGGYTYSWSGPDGFTANTQNLSNIGPGEYTVTVTDAKGCTDELTVTITEPESNVNLICPPTITLCPNENIPLPYATLEEFLDAGGQVFTDCPLGGFNASTFNIIRQVSNNQKCPEIITRTYQITDFCGHVVTCEQRIIIDDQTPPIMSPPRDIQVECYATLSTDFRTFRNLQEFIDAGGRVSDNCGVDPTTFRQVGPDRMEGTTCDGTIRRTYAVRDYCGNERTTDVLYIIKDDRGPRVLTGPTTLEVECVLPRPYANYQEFLNAGGLALDDCSNVTLRFEKDEILQDGCPKIVRRTYVMSDACGNTTPFVQTITVNDAEPPAFALRPPTSAEACSEVAPFGTYKSFLDAGYLATDNCGIDASSWTWSDEVSGTSCPKTITRTYTVADLCGNTASFVQTFTIDDKEAPVFVNPPGDMVYECIIPDAYLTLASYTSAGFTVYDNCGLIRIAGRLKLTPYKLYAR
jgi:hypothetical protein